MGHRQPRAKTHAREARESGGYYATGKNMKEHNQIINLLSEGLSPAQISEQCKVPTKSVIEQISLAVNEGRVRRSDVMASLKNAKWWQIIATWGESIWSLSPEKICPYLKATEGIDADISEISLFLAYANSPVRAGDMYQLIYDIERNLHANIRRVLVMKFGNGENGWWGKGVPKEVRLKCVQAREEDCEFVDGPFSYTTFINLREIIKVNWSLFEKRLPLEITNGNGKNSNKEKFLGDLMRLNPIRNKVMHPVRGEPPTEEDYEFLKELQRLLVLSKWR